MTDREGALVRRVIETTIREAGRDQVVASALDDLVAQATSELDCTDAGSLLDKASGELVEPEAYLAKLKIKRPYMFKGHVPGGVRDAEQHGPLPGAVPERREPASGRKRHVLTMREYREMARRVTGLDRHIVGRRVDSKRGELIEVDLGSNVNTDDLIGSDMETYKRWRERAGFPTPLNPLASMT